MDTKKAPNRKRLSTSTDHELYEALKSLSKQSRIPLARLIDEAIKDLMVKHNQTKESHTENT